MYGVVDLPGDLLRVRLGLFIVTANEHLAAGRVAHGAEAVGHAVFRRHIACDGGGALDVVGSAGGDIVQPELLGHASAQKRDDGFKHLAARGKRLILGGQADGHTAGRAARDDGDEVHRVLRGQHVHRHRVARLVHGGELPLTLGDDAAAFLRACDELDHRLLQMRHGDDGTLFARGHQRALVEKVRKIGAREACRLPGQHVKIDVLCKRLVLRMHLQNFAAALSVGRADIDLPVEAARAQQRRVENIFSVGGGNDDDLLVGRKAVHFDEQLVERLLALVMPAAEPRAASAADSVDLVDEDDGGRDLLRLIEEVAHAACAYADIQLHKIRAGDRQKRHARLARDGAGQQRLARARGADQQHALGNARAQLLKAARLTQKVDDLGQLGLFLVRARHVGKGDGFLVGASEAGVGPGEFGHGVAAVCVSGEQKPHQQKRRADQYVHKYRAVPRCFDAGVVIAGEDTGIVLAGDERVEVGVEHVRVADFGCSGQGTFHGLAQLDAQRTAV